MEDKYHYDIIEKAIGFLYMHRKEHPSLDQVAANVNLSKFHFQRLFQEWAGVSPKTFQQFLTVNEAKKSLRVGKSTLASAHDLGLSGSSRLHDAFLKIESCTPGEFKQYGQNLAIQWITINTCFGLMIVAETQRGICHLAFGSDESLLHREMESCFFKARFYNELGTYGKQVKDYFNSWELPSTKISLHLRGTPFQIQVWKALLQIPSAQLVSYGDVGHFIDRPTASRAVGTAVGKNAIAYLIPCHRVIKSDGIIGNYRWGSKRKMSMIGLERSNVLREPDNDSKESTLS